MEARAERMYKEQKAAKAAEKGSKIPAIQQKQSSNTTSSRLNADEGMRRGYTKQPQSPKRGVSFKDETPKRNNSSATSPRSGSLGDQGGGAYSPRSPRTPGVASKQELEDENRELRGMLDRAKAEMREMRVTIKDKDTEMSRLEVHLSTICRHRISPLISTLICHR